MKKRILSLIILLLLLTGCTCEYNLTIDNNVYKEEINLTGENNEENSNINNKWKVPVDKDEYNKGGDPESNSYISGDIYEYKVTGNILKFNYDFTKSTYPNSSAVSNCYDKLTVLNYENSTVISTSSKATCFDEYPLLTSITVNIKVDKPVTSNNADNVNGNVYTWNITKDNHDNKPINIILENSNINDDNPNSNTPNSNPNNNNPNNDEQKKENDYTLYIFSGILLIVMLTVYFIVNKISKKNNVMDD